MKVRILSGNQTGTIVEQSQDEAEVNIATGFAEAVLAEPASVLLEPVVESAPAVDVEPVVEPEAAVTAETPIEPAPAPTT